MRNALLAASLGCLLIGAGAPAAIITVSETAPSGSIIAQPDFSGSAGGGDYTDNGGPSAQTFTAPQNFTLTGVTIKGNANNGGSFGAFSAGVTFSIAISEVVGSTLSQIDLETVTFQPTDGAAYLTFTLEPVDPINLAGGTQYAFTIYSSSGFYGLDESSTDVYAGGAAIQHGSTARTASSGASITNTQSTDRTFFIAGTVPEPASLSALALAMGAVLRRRR